VKLKVYEYKNCGTCKKALKFLNNSKIEFNKIPIRETPPTKQELNKMLSFYDSNVQKLFNTSGNDYRELNLKEKLPSMSLDEQLDLLSKNGNLVKRPFLLGKDFGMVGFKEEEWKKKFN